MCERASECNRESSTVRRPWPTRGLLRHGKELSTKALLTVHYYIELGTEEINPRNILSLIQ